MYKEDLTSEGVLAIPLSKKQSRYNCSPELQDETPSKLTINSQKYQPNRTGAWRLLLGSSSTEDRSKVTTKFQSFGNHHDL